MPPTAQRCTRVDPNRVRWFRQRLRRWHRNHFRTFPWRQTRDPYAVLVAELLLHQTFARKVIPVYQELMREYPDARHLAGAEPGYVEGLLLPLGLKRRSQRLIALANLLVREHEGRVPSDEAGLLALPGVGPYTAGAVCTFAHGRRAAIADTNVVRILKRFFGLGAPESPPPKSVSLAMREAALEIVPRLEPRSFNFALLDFAALVCTHYRPRCATCPVRARCPAAGVFASRG